MKEQTTCSNEFLRAPKRKHKHSSIDTTGAKTTGPSKAYPKSLSVKDMLKLGKVICDQIGTEPIELFTFDIGSMAWSRNGTTVEFSIEKDHLVPEAFEKHTKRKATPQDLSTAVEL